MAEELRSQHLGSRVFEELWELSRRRYADISVKPLGLVWEVDKPELASGDAERVQGNRRLAFFGRLGGRLLPQPYVQPPVDGVAPVEMGLMFRPADGSTLPDSRTCAALVQALYYEKYHRANGIALAVLDNLLHRIGVEGGRQPV